MQHFFTRANEALYKDLSDYVSILRKIIATLPLARAHCEQAVREVRLVQALLAFGSGREVIELTRICLHLGNLWAVREEGPARTSGFSRELEESSKARTMSDEALKLIAVHEQDALSLELRVCFLNIISLLKEEERLLAECEALLGPFRTSPELTRKRLHLLVAAAEARLPDTAERRASVQTYLEAAELLAEWENGITLDERGIQVLERCLMIISHSSESFGVLAVTAHSAMR